MTPLGRTLSLATLLACAPAGWLRAALPPILLAEADGTAPPDQMRRLLLRETDEAWVRWQERFEARTEPAAIAAHAAQLRGQFLALLGGLPARTPLNPRVTGAIAADGFRVEKIVFESRPQFFVTANLYLPDPARHPPRWPGVIVPCGHYQPAKAHDEYQAMGVLLALNGLAALVFDPIEQGERLQAVDAAGRARFWGTNAHSLDGIQAIPLGQNVARQLVWDGMRALDYLQSRPEIDPDRLGVTGNSGGGTQTSYLMALDDRIQAAAPSCYITNLASQLHGAVGDAEQHLFDQIRVGLDHPDFLLLRAPSPVQLLAATRDFFDIRATWDTFRIAKRGYTRLGRSEAVDLLENDAGHNYDRVQREAAVRWLVRWLRGEDREIREPDRRLFTEEELRCTPGGQVLLLPGARSFRDLLREDADAAATRRTAAWTAADAEQRRAAVRRLARFRALADIPPAAWSPVWTESGPGYRLEAWRVRVEDGALTLPALWLEPAMPGGEPVLIHLSDAGLAEDAAPGGPLDQLARSGRRVLALDVRGTGATRQRAQQGMTAAIGNDYQDLYTASSLGRTYVGMQAEDVLIAVREALRRSGQRQVDLAADGGVAVPALHAAFTAPQQFRRLTLDHMIESWDGIVRADRTFGQLMNAVHGALTMYDLPDLVTVLGPAVTVRHPVGPLGLSRDASAPSPADRQPSVPGLVGLLFGSPGFLNPQALDSLSGGDARWGAARGRDWSARWTGYLVPDRPGPITLRFETNEEAVVRLGGRAVAGTTTLAADTGAATTLEVDFNKPRRRDEEKDHVSTFRLLWQDPAGTWQPVPADWLRHSRVQRDTCERSLR